MPRVNPLIADDVGLGKTIKAGLVAQELIIRHRCRRILIVCPSSLQIQWRDQMRDKFGLDFRIVGSVLMKKLRRQRGIHVIHRFTFLGSLPRSIFLGAIALFVFFGKPYLLKVNPSTLAALIC